MKVLAKVQRTNTIVAEIPLFASLEEWDQLEPMDTPTDFALPAGVVPEGSLVRKPHGTQTYRIAEGVQDRFMAPVIRVPEGRVLLVADGYRFALIDAATPVVVLETPE